MDSIWFIGGGFSRTTSLLPAGSPTSKPSLHIFQISIILTVQYVCSTATLIGKKSYNPFLTPSPKPHTTLSSTWTGSLTSASQALTLTEDNILTPRPELPLALANQKHKGKEVVDLKDQGTQVHKVVCVDLD